MAGTLQDFGVSERSDAVKDRRRMDSMLNDCLRRRGTPNQDSCLVMVHVNGVILRDHEV